MRLVVLMVEVEQPEGVSARKLILEAARHNVISAYTGQDAVDLLRRFPNVDLAVIHTELNDAPFEHTVSQFRTVRADLPIVAITPFSGRQAKDVDYVISSYEPQMLLQLLAERFEAATSETD